LPFTVRSMRRRFRLRCPGCGEIHDRVRRPRGRVACLRCCRIHSGGKYDERYRLIITSLDEAS
jgi:ribosomal protein S27E